MNQTTITLSVGGVTIDRVSVQEDIENGKLQHVRSLDDVQMYKQVSVQQTTLLRCKRLVNKVFLLLHRGPALVTSISVWGHQ